MTPSGSGAPRGFAGLMSFVTVIPPAEDIVAAARTDQAATFSPRSGQDASLEARVERNAEPARAETVVSKSLPRSFFGGAGLLWVVLLGIVGLAFLVNNYKSTNSRTDQSRPPIASATTFAPIPTPTIATSPPSPSPYPIAAPDTTEAMPPVGTDLSFTRANIRYCEYQKQRIEVARGLVTNETTAVFNGLVDDWNSRCSSFRYWPTDRATVEAEVAQRQSQFEAEARALMSVYTPYSPPAVPIASDTPPTSVPPYSPEVTSMPVGTPSTSSPAQADTGLSVNIGPRESSKPFGVEDGMGKMDLLNEDDVMRIQRRLTELGFFKGPANGTWGPMSRVALRNFKFANGLGTDDGFDDDVHARLMAPTAIRAGPGTSTSLNSGAEAHYAPPPGATLNPLNSKDATKVNGRLRALGYFSGKNDSLWSGASRVALRAFKQKFGLGTDSKWDAATEAALFGSNE